MRKLFLGLFGLITFWGYGQYDSTGYLNNFQYTINWSSESVVGGDTVAMLRCHLNIPDTASLAAVEVKVGNYKGDGSVLNYVFPLDSNFGLPNGYVLTQNGNGVSILLGAQEPRTYFYTISLLDSFGKKSAPLFYSSTSNQLSWQ